MAARLARNKVLYDGCFAHVISRSIRKQPVFNDSEDFGFFRESLLKAKKEGSFKIYHYCLMRTHFHLVVGMSGVLQFSKAIQKLKGQFTCHFHTKYRQSGPIWRERFRALIIEDEEYLYACGRYVENNPVKAGMVSDSSEWMHSSNRHYQGIEVDPLIDSYEDGLPNLPKQYEDGMFEQGFAIGSSFFRFQKKEALKVGR